jgi:hypothetical protein
VGRQFILVFLLHELVQRFETEAQGQVVGILAALSQPGLVDDAGDQDEIVGFDDSGQLVEKGLFVRTTGESEASTLLANVRLVEHDHIVPKMLELEALQRRHDVADVVSLLKDAERQHKHRILRVDTLQTVIAALIHVDHEVAVLPV